MLFQRINRTDKEKAYIIVQNKEATNMVNGDVVMWSQVAANRGTGVLFQVTTVGNPLVAGVCVDTIEPDEYGRVQVYGHHAAIKATGAIAAGVAIEGSATSKTCQTITVTGAPGSAFGASLAAAAGGLVEAMIKNM